MNIKIPRKLSLLDVGARGGLQWPWDRIAEDLSVTLVEPDATETLNGNVIRDALWSEPANLTLYITRAPGASSVFRPNRQFLDLFPESDRFNVVREVPIRAVTLDSLSQHFDFIKLDTQGSELAILQGATHALERVIGLEIEVEFSPMYQGQPIFSDVDNFVRQQGFELWDIRRTYWKAKSDDGGKGRLIFGDALYFRPRRSMSVEQCVMLDLALSAYGYGDRGLRPLSNGSWPLFVLFDALAKAFLPRHNGWASGGETLGSKRHLLRRWQSAATLGQWFARR